MRLKLETLTKETVITTSQNMLSTMSLTNVISVIRSEEKGQGEDCVQCCTILINFYLTCKLSFTTEYLTPAVFRSWQFPFTQTWAIGVNTVWLLTTTYFFLPCNIFSSLCVYKTHISAELILSGSYIQLPYMSCTTSLVKVIWNMATWIIKWKTVNDISHNLLVCVINYCDCRKEKKEQTMKKNDWEQKIPEMLLEQNCNLKIMWNEILTKNTKCF